MNSLKIVKVYSTPKHPLIVQWDGKDDYGKRLITWTFLDSEQSSILINGIDKALADNKKGLDKYEPTESYTHEYYELT